MGAMAWMVMYVILLNIISNKGCGVSATTIDCQNAFAPIDPVLCFVWWSKYMCLRVMYKVQTHVLKGNSVHSIHSLWKSKRMATYTCNACVITTWRLELQALLAACDYPLYKYKRVNIHLFQIRLLQWTVFHSLHCTMINSCSGKFSLVHVHWNNGDHLWKAFKRAFKSK